MSPVYVVINVVHCWRFKIVGAVTTYLVIFIQFDQSSSVDNSSDGLNNSTLGLTETICGNE